ncbi:hypothetical protein Pmani_020896 [Petrolisthes manimaculis]|uniref:Uncharacterized protein n=1 Tax=Petrolisthes manimaculis TaxID=1843537 RepID=A0AAE1PHJ7_9EUCA|nr:hypothetical protein Pmani_020896 [Petrolisthes manimaculis]
MLRERERAMDLSAANASLSHNQSAHDLTPLEPGQRARIQNPENGRWDRSGTIMEQTVPRQYLIRLDGSGRATHRNRRHLRPANNQSPAGTRQGSTNSVPGRPPSPRPQRIKRAPRRLGITT